MQPLACCYAVCWRQNWLIGRTGPQGQWRRREPSTRLPAVRQAACMRIGQSIAPHANELVSPPHASRDGALGLGSHARAAPVFLSCGALRAVAAAQSFLAVRLGVRLHAREDQSGVSGGRISELGRVQHVTTPMPRRCNLFTLPSPCAASWLQLWRDSILHLVETAHSRGSIICRSR